MENFLKRFTAVIAALSIVIVNVSFSVFADASDDDSVKAVLNYYLDSIDAFTSGSITYEQFTDMQANASGRMSALVADRGMGLLPSKYIEQLSYNISSTVVKYSEMAPYYLSEWLSDLMSKYEKTGQQSTFDMRGHGACAFGRSDGIYRGSAYYCDYIVINVQYLSVRLIGNAVQHNFDWNEDYNFGDGYSFSNNTVRFFDFYGDVRYEDGSPYPTNDEYVGYIYRDFSDASEKELEELLKKINEKIEQETPDFSNVEGLLKSIYYRLGTLDSDDDNAILTEINASILSLANNSTTDNTELIEVLAELKEALKDRGTEGESADLSEVIKKMEEIKGAITGLSLIEVSDNLLELTEAESKLFDEYANLVPLLVQKVGFSAVSSTMSNIESVIFTSSPPSDFRVNIFGEEYAILSASIFTDESIKYIQMARTFISVILVYSWCMMMRKKLTGGEN